MLAETVAAVAILIGWWTLRDSQPANLRSDLAAALVGIAAGLIVGIAAI